MLPAMTDLKLTEHDVLSFLQPDTLFGALVYLSIFLTAALLAARALRTVVHAALTRRGHIDRTTVSFMQQFGTALIWVIVVILYAHLIPELRSLGTALLAGASIASVVIGLAAQSTLGNLVAGISITLYRPFRLGDTIQVAAPTGPEIGSVEMISLGYTTLRTADGRLVVVPNALAASQVSINLGSTYLPALVTLAIRVSRDADLEAARKLALDVGAATVGEKAVLGCFLSKVEATAAVLELRVQSPDAASRDLVRAQLLSSLAQRFAAPGFAIGSERPTFS
jgi:small conductance mechanosensitive channel